MYGPLTFLTTWRAVGLLVVLFVLAYLGFAVRADALDDLGFTRRAVAAGRPNKVLDVRRWYTPRDARDLMDDLDDRGRCVYAWTEVTLDLFFPAVYAGLFAGLIGNL